MPIYTPEDLNKLLAIHKRIYGNLVELYRLCLADPKEHVVSPKFHYTLSDILMNDKNHFAVEMFRESAKSSYVLKAYPISRLVHPSEDTRYLVIIKQNTRLAEGKLLEIIFEYESNAILSGNLIRVIKRSGQAYEVMLKGKGGTRVHMRIEAYGKGASVRGLTWNNMRPQIVIMDDIQDLEDSQSEITLEKDWEWFLSDIKFLSKTGRIFIIGNNLGKLCVIERIIDNAPDLSFQVMKVAALNTSGESVWPEKFTTEFLKKEKEEFTILGKLEIWYRERMCEAITPETQKFKPEYFRFFEEKELPETFNIDITIDPAISKRKTACNTSIVAVAKNDNMPDWFILDYKAGKYDPYELINHTFSMYQELKRLYPKAMIQVWVEGVAYQEALKYVFEEEMRRQGIFMFLDTFVDNSDKERRILGLVPLFRVGVIHMRKWMTKLQEEALLFPKGATVDIIDGLSFHQHIKSNTVDKLVEKKEEPTIGMDGNLHGLIEKMQYHNQSNHMDDTYL